jgi:hypothetical protein
MLANFQINRMILAIFIGLERSMMDFLVTIIILELFFQLRQMMSVWPQNCTECTKKNPLQDLSDSKSSRGALGCYRWKSEFWSQILSIFFGHVPYIPYRDGTWKVKSDPQFDFMENKNQRFWVFPKKMFFQNFAFIRLFFRPTFR